MKTYPTRCSVYYYFEERILTLVTGITGCNNNKMCLVLKNFSNTIASFKRILGCV